MIESEEKNQHVLSNVPGADHITGMYHWVNRISRGQVMGYGKRLMFDLVVPEPAEPYKRLSTVAVAPAGAPATIDLAAIVAGPGAVTRANYLDLLAHPALVALDAGGISAPPPAEVILTCAMSGVEQPAASHAGPLVLDVKDLMIPEKYQTISFSVFAKTTWNQLQQDQFNQGDNAKDLFVQIGYASSYLHGGNSAEQDRPLPGLSGQLHVMAHAWGANSTTVTLWIRCALTVEAYRDLIARALAEGSSIPTARSRPPSLSTTARSRRPPARRRRRRPTSRSATRSSTARSSVPSWSGSRSR